MPRKPTGMNAPVKLTTGKPPEVLGFKLPDDKERAEKIVADMFVINTEIAEAAAT